MLKNQAAFDKKLATAEKQVNSARKNYWEAAQFALSHYAKCGDTGPINRQFQSMSRVGKVVKGTGFGDWVVLYSDLEYDLEAKVFVKTSKGEPQVNLAEALKHEFWELNKTVEEELAEATAQAMKEALFAIVNKFTNEKKYKQVDTTEANAEAIRKLAEALK